MDVFDPRIKLGDLEDRLRKVLVEEEPADSHDRLGRPR